MLDAMKRFIEMFASRTTDRTTLDELQQMIADRGTWHQANDLFQRIRRKTLDAARRGDVRLEAQYCFEEVCAKTLYNLTGRPAPFDMDSPYWIIPNALATARHLEIDATEIVAVIAA
jgi:hypothetical protein